TGLVLATVGYGVVRTADPVVKLPRSLDRHDCGSGVGKGETSGYPERPRSSSPSVGNGRSRGSAAKLPQVMLASDEQRPVRHRRCRQDRVPQFVNRQHLPLVVAEQDDLQLPAFGHDEQLVFGNDGAAAVASLQPQLPQTPAVLPPGGGKHARPVDDIQPFSLDDWAGDPGPQAA